LPHGPVQRRAAPHSRAIVAKDDAGDWLVGNGR
jgi:hypothetical protein